MTRCFMYDPVGITSYTQDKDVKYVMYIGCRDENAAYDSIDYDTAITVLFSFFYDVIGKPHWLSQMIVTHFSSVAMFADLFEKIREYELQHGEISTRSTLEGILKECGFKDITAPEVYEQMKQPKQEEKKKGWFW